jgi:zinc protease
MTPLISPLPSELPAIPPGVVLTRLENGLTIIVKEDRSAPVVSAQAWCQAGSIHEGKWLGAGLSHVLEHMLFKGTTTRPGTRIDQEVQEAGGYMNAYTSFDRTVYHIDAPNTGAVVAVDILCDIMQHASLPADEMEKEKQVILREMDMNVDDPGRRASRRLFETAYTRSPYRFTVIGYPDIFNELKSEDIRDYYQEKYAPNNVFFLITGDVSAAAVVGQVTEAYRTTKARPAPAVYLMEEPRQTAPREVVEQAPIELGHLHFAWHIPDIRHPDTAALDVLAVLLGSGRSSRLYQQVREKQALVHSADAWLYSPGGPGLFGMSALVDADNYIAAREAMLAEIEALKTGSIPAAELAKAVKQFISATLASRKTMQGQAQDLGSSWIAAQDLNFSQRYLSAIKRVTMEDLRRVAVQYLTAENRTTYALLPARQKADEATSLPAPSLFPVRKVTLPNGLRLLLKEDHRLPFVEFRALFRGGVLAEKASNSGITQMTGKLLLKGTASRSAEDIALAIESIGGSIDTYGGNNSFGVNAEVLTDDFAAGLDLVFDVIRHPQFPVESLEREREVQLASIRALRDHLLQSAFKSMRHAMFGASGYGLDTLGSETSVSKLTQADFQNFHEQFVRPDNCVLAIYGDIDPAQVERAVAAAAADWQAPGPLCGFAGAPTQILRSIERVSEKHDKKQAVLVVGFPGTTLMSPDRYVLEILQEACSDLGSRLFLRIREELGLAYFVGAQNFVGFTPGFFAFYVGTAPENAAQVESELMKEAENLRRDGLAEGELRRAKAKIIGQHKIARQDLGGVAMAQALDELYGLGYAYSDAEDARYEAVTLDEVRAAARRYLTPEALVVTLLSP